jgi:hypothetical protein
MSRPVLIDSQQAMYALTLLLANLIKIGNKTGQLKERQKIRQLHKLSLTLSTC